MKKIFFLVTWFFVNATIFAQTPDQKPTTSVSNFSDVDNVFMIIGILLVVAFVMIPMYSLSHAVKVLAKKAEKN